MVKPLVPNEKGTVISVLITQEQFAKLRHIRKVRGFSRSEVIRAGINRYLNDEFRTLDTDKTRDGEYVPYFLPPGETRKES